MSAKIINFPSPTLAVHTDYDKLKKISDAVSRINKRLAELQEIIEKANKEASK